MIGTLLTIKESAERLNMSEKALRNRIARHEIPVVRIGARTLRIDSLELDRMLEGGRERAWTDGMRSDNG